MTDRTAEVTAFHAAAEWTGVTDTDREAWLALRHTMLTASDVAAIMGEDDHRSALDVYVDKVTERGAPEVITLEDPRFWGAALEQPILRAVAKYFGWGYRKGGALLRSRRYPFLGATLDAEIDRGDGLGWLDFEGKTTRVPGGWDEDSGDLPTRVLIQVQTQLLVTGAPLAVVFALLQGSRPCRVEVHPSAEYHTFIVEESERFMAAVAALDPPAPDGKESATRALSRLYPRDDGSVVSLPAEAVEWTREYQEWGSKERLAKKRKEYFAQELKRAIGESKYGVLHEPVGGKSCWRWQLQEREAYQVEAGESRVLIALKDAPATSVSALPAANTNALSTLLAKSIGDNESGPAGPIRYATPRRKTRR